VPITLHVREVDLATALRTLTRLAGATYHKEGDPGIYVIGRRPPPAAPAGPSREGALEVAQRSRDEPPAEARADVRERTKVTLDLKGVALRQALEVLFDGTGRQYAVDANVPNNPITLTLKEVSFQTTLREIVRLAGATYRQEGDLLLIESHPADSALAAAGDEPPMPPAVEKAEPRSVTMDLDRVPVREAFMALFHAAREKLRIEPSVPDTPITVHVRETDFDAVLRMMTRLSGTTCTREGDTYVLRGGRS
jgi:hypothetical protein